MSSKKKYIKYKIKYLNLKQNNQTNYNLIQIGGSDNTTKTNDEILRLYKTNNLSPKQIINQYSLNYILDYYKSHVKHKQNEQTIIDIIIKYNKSIVNLASITNHFVLPIRMKCLIEKYDKTPYDLYLEQKKLTQNVSIYDLNKILKTSCTLLDYTRVIYLLNLLCPNNNNIKYIDSSSGWGDRLIAALLYGVSEYRGYDPNTALTTSYNNIKKYFHKNNLCGKYAKSSLSSSSNIDIRKYTIIPKPFEIDYDDEKDLINYFDICISSPPFFTFEKYSDDSAQSIYSDDNKELDITGWLENFLYPAFKKLLKLIKPNGHICWYIEDKPEYNFLDTFINYAKNLNCKYYGKIGFKYDDRDEVRYFLIFIKI
jgi:hypothetical protein